IARREFGAESNTLNALTERFGITSKSDKYDAGIAEAALSGDREAQRRLAAYNRGDIVATAGLYEYLRPWDPSHPHPKQVNASEALTCNSCWGGNLEPNGYTLASLYMYRLYRCLDCGANVQESKNVGRAAYTRGADDRPGNALWLPMGSYGSRAVPRVSRRARGATKNRQGKNPRGCSIPNGPVGQSVARRKEDGDSPMTWHQWDDDTTQAALDGARLAYRHPQVRQAAALEDVEQDALEYIATHPDEVEAYKANGWTHVLV